MKRLIITQGLIENNIFLIRGQKIMIDRDLAKLYGVETKYLNRQVKRNIGRFPGEFMFQLNPEEKNELVTKCHRFETMKHSSVLPYAFTEHGVAMLASVLKSETAVKISIQSNFTRAVYGEGVPLRNITARARIPLSSTQIHPFRAIS